jgi:glycine oxidase
MTSYDIAIVGNGILGCATALELLRRDPSLRVAVIGPGGRRFGATPAAGAMLNCFAEVTHRTLSSPAGRAKLELAADALRAWPQWLAELADELPPGQCPAITPGTYLILNSRGGRLDSLNYRAVLDAMAEYQQPAEEVDPATITGLDPVVDARPICAAYLPAEGSLDAPAALAAICAAAERRGAVFVDATVRTLAGSAGRVDRADLTSGDQVSAGLFLLAAGARTGKLLSSVTDGDRADPRGWPVGDGLAAGIPWLMAGIGVSLLAELPAAPPTAVIRTPNRAGACGLHAIPRGGSTVYLGATNDLMLFPESSPRAGPCHFLLDCAIDQLNEAFFASQVLGWHVGCRPATLDGFPLIGRGPGPNLWILSGTYRDGFHGTPVLARHMAAELTGQAGVLGDHPFTPMRPLLRSLTVADSVEEMVLHFVSGAYENALRLPRYLGHTYLEDSARQTALEIYRELDTDFGLGPDVLTMLAFLPRRDQVTARMRDYLARAVPAPLAGGRADHRHRGPMVASPR